MAKTTSHIYNRKGLKLVNTHLIQSEHAILRVPIAILSKHKAMPCPSQTDTTCISKSTLYEKLYTRGLLSGVNSCQFQYITVM